MVFLVDLTDFVRAYVLYVFSIIDFAATRKGWQGR